MKLGMYIMSSITPIGNTNSAASKIIIFFTELRTHTKVFFLIILSDT
jgi:hypothetical protein